MFTEAWRILKDAVLSFIEDEALSRGAAIAFYTVTSIAPLLLIIIAVVGLFSDRGAAQAAITEQLAGIMGSQTAEVLNTAVTRAAESSSSGLAALVGICTLILTASGAFGEIQSALNKIWKTKPSGTTLSRLVRARAASLGLVVTMGFLLVVSLVASAAITAFGQWLNAILPFGKVILSILNVFLSSVLISLLFAAVYKVLPDRKLRWRDVLFGAAVTAVLFVVGKSIIGWYLGSSNIASAYGAAGSLIVLLLWVYYSVQIFLLGAELTKAFSTRQANPQRQLARSERSAQQASTAR